MANAAGFAVETGLCKGSEVIQSSRLALRCTKSWFLAQQSREADSGRRKAPPADSSTLDTKPHSDELPVNL